MTVAIPPTFGTSLFRFTHNQPHNGWLRVNLEWEQSFRWWGGKNLCERKNALGYVAKKSGTRPLQSFSCFFLFRGNLLFRLIRFFLFFLRSRIKPGGYHNDAVTLLTTFWIRPFFRPEVAYNGNQLSFFQYIEGIHRFILSPGFNPNESGNIRGFSTCLVCTADRDREACNAGCLKTTDFRILTDKTCHCEWIFNLFHISDFLEVN